MTQFLDDPARAAAVAAARARIEPGMIIGLGSGRAVF
jgi:ribose 5-phosphate isomerase